MNIFICGQKSFGKEVLKALYDKMQGYAIKLGIPVISDCDKLVSRDIPENTDLVVAAHSHWYISTKIREKAKYGAIGFHPSLLPRHRGQDAVRWTVAMGEAITGATVFWLDDSVDGGEIFLQRAIHVSKKWDYHDLWKQIFPIGVEMICEAVENIEKGNIIKMPQDNQFATWEPSFTNTRLKRNELLQIGNGLNV